jgi:hypothetical protein
MREIAPSALISYTSNPVSVQDMVLAEQPELEFASKEDIIYHMTHKVNNQFHSNGRIYMKLTKQGELYANSVSPYSEKFLDNIEEKIKPLVQAFHNKRYLTYSSCEGHGLSFRRYVGLAFCSEETREYVAQQILNLKLPGIKVNRLAHVCNQKVGLGKKNTPQIDSKYTQEELKQDFYFDEEILTFNIQFHRNYEQYYFLEIVILEAIPYGWHGIGAWFKKVWLGFLKKYYWDKLTCKIVNLVESSAFKKYHY